MPSGPTPANNQLAALAESKPAAILLIAATADAAQLTRAIRGLAPTDSPATQPRRFGSQSMARQQFLALAGAAAEGVRFPLLCPVTPETAAANEFNTRFLTERGPPPDYAAMLTYDATRLLLDAIRTTGPNRSSVRTALVQLSPWQGIAGSIAFDGTGQNTRTNVQMATLRDGHITAIGASNPQFQAHAISAGKASPTL